MPTALGHLHHVSVGFEPGADLARYDTPLANGRRVLIRTTRGVELGRVLSTIRGDVDDAGEAALSILRPTEPADEWLLGRLAKRKIDAVRQCQTLLRRAGCDAVLLDVDLLYDGGTMILRWLGEPDAIGEELLRSVVEQYESAAEVTHLADRIATGCGPGCGTPGTGCDGGSCATCPKSQTKAI